MSASTDFINGVNTTSLRILVSLLLAVVYVIVILAGAVLGKTLPVEALNTAGLFIFGMMGVDAAVFTAKRFSDVNYAAAKTPPVAATVEMPVVVRPAAASVGAPPVAATAAPSAVPTTPTTSEKGL